MAIHYFHCTDGHDIIVDKRGREAESLADLRQAALDVAREIRAAVPAFGDWDHWAVHVYDSRGAVEIVPFRASPAPDGPSREDAFPEGRVD